jgi:hypothetical protein
MPPYRLTKQRVMASCRKTHTCTGARAEVRCTRAGQERVGLAGGLRSWTVRRDSALITTRLRSTPSNLAPAAPPFSPSSSHSPSWGSLG